MIRKGIFRSYARASLLINETQPGTELIDEFLDSPTFARLTLDFERDLSRAMSEFRANHSPPAPVEAAAAEGPPVVAPPPEVPRSRLTFRLPNARAGDAYAQVLTPLTAPPRSIVYLAIAVPPELGLVSDLASGKVSGTPAAAGEFDIPILFHFEGESPPEQQAATVSLLVNQDPKLLWKNLPSDQTDPFWKPDEQCSSVAGADFRIVAASKRGRSHAHVGAFRDDDYLIDHLPGTGWYLAVVSDGAGSARYSRRGSQIICEKAAEHLKHTLDGPTGHEVAEAAAALHAARTATPPDEIRVEAATKLLESRLFVAVGHAAHHSVKAIHEELASRPELGAAYKDFYCTAMISAARRFPFGTLCVAYWVGDGAVGVYSKTAGIQLLGDVDSGDFSGQTRFLDSGEVSADALSRRTRFALVDDMTALILMTDGVSDPKFDTESNLGRRVKWDELWDDLEYSAGLFKEETAVEQRLLSWLDFWSQGNHDDRTIAVLLRE